MLNRSTFFNILTYSAVICFEQKSNIKTENSDQNAEIVKSPKSIEKDEVEVKNQSNKDPNGVIDSVSIFFVNLFRN